MTPNPQDSAVALEVERAAFEAWFWLEPECKGDCWEAWQARASQSDGTSGGWMPIETIPETGKFLVYMPDERTPIQVATWHPNIKVIGGSFAFDLSKPTHWMNLPAAPNQGENHVG